MPAGGRFHLYFEDKMNAHVEKAARDRRLQISHQSGDVSTESLSRFFADHIRIGPEQLVPAFVRHQPEARYSFHHFQQRVKGYNVQYGGIIAMVGSHEEVISAHGHILENELIPERYEGVQHIETDVAKQAVLNQLTLKHGSASISPEFCTVADWETETVWYMSEATLGRTGPVYLTVRVSGPCVINSAREVMSISAFVDVQSGIVIALQNLAPQFVDPDKISSFMLRRRALKRGTEVSANENESDRRRLNVYSDVSVQVSDYSTSAVYFVDDTATEVPSTPATILPTATFTVGMARMMRSVSNQDWLSYKQSAALLRAQVGYTSFNAYYDGTKVVIGDGLNTEDVIAHEWGHGYTDYSSGLVYSNQPGALNEGFSDCYGESYDILKTGSQPLMAAKRSTTPRCTVGPWAYGSEGTDNSVRWIMGDKIVHPYCGAGCAVRDMYAPACFGDPDSTSSGNIVCNPSQDNGGVHSNSGLLNRLYAIIVDGGAGNSLSVDGFGLTKALNLFFRTELGLGSTAQFTDFASSLQATCVANIGSDLYTPSLSGDSVVDAATLSAADCTMVSTAISIVGLNQPICVPPTRSPTRSPTRRPSAIPTSRRPTAAPSSRVPTASPSRRPTAVPSSRRPTESPTLLGSVTPTSSRPTVVPSSTVPASSPTLAPVRPTPAPSAKAAKSKSPN